MGKSIDIHRSISEDGNCIEFPTESIRNMFPIHPPWIIIMNIQHHHQLHLHDALKLSDFSLQINLSQIAMGMATFHLLLLRGRANGRSGEDEWPGCW